ncbi:Heavy metal-associated isoprenylated plant protein 31 [Linum grandiflorum]
MPVDILHLVLRRIPFSKETVQTAALSRQWGNLWRSYPVVEFNSSSEEDDCYLSDSYQKIIEGFKDFSDATIERFSRDEQLRMETLKISLITFSYDLSSLAVEQLLDLACKRKAEYVTVKVVCSVCLPLGLLTSSSANAKTLHFQGIRFMLNKNIDCDPLLCLNFLRSLILDNVDLYGGDRLLTNLIASSPLLDTLKLLDVEGIRKLSMSNVPNLKSLEIASCGDLVEIEIAAPGLQNMLIKQALYDDRHVLELIAPQLNILEIVQCDRSTLGTISKLEFLKSLKLSRPRGDLPLLPRSLRFLWLTGLELTEEQVLLNLIAGSPFLETLELVSILKLRKLQVVNLANLKTLNIMYCFSLEEIEIAAFELQSLCIHGSDYIEMNLSKIELIAPELNALELIYSGLKVDDLECLVSKLPSLKSLSLDGFSPPTEKKLKLLGHKLEEIKLAGLAGLEEIEIELDVVPRLEKFVLECNELADQIKKCEITNSAASCQWEVDFRMRRTSMEKQPTKLAAVGENLISNLPDEILHSVLRLIPCSNEAAQTAGLSRRWGNLWRSYPVVEFDYRSIAGLEDWLISNSKIVKGFQKFSEATMERFCRDKQLGMESLNISLYADEDDLLSLAVEQLLDLASKRKAEDVTIQVNDKFVVRLPLGLFMSSSANAKTIRFQGIRFVPSKNIDYDPLVCFNSLRSLILFHVDLDGGERLFANLIASSPLLETLKLLFVKGISKLSIMSNVANLKELVINYFDDLEQIEIAAPGLQTMVIKRPLYDVDRHVFELIAPQLNSLEIEYCDIFRLGMISKLEFLKSLKLSYLCGDLPLLPRSLRFLWLTGLDLTEQQVLLNLIAGSPFLETLELMGIGNLRKLQLVNLANLKTLNIIWCFSLEEIEIAAFELQSLRIQGSDFTNGIGYRNMKLSKIELIAPELNAFELIYSGLKVDDLECVVSKLPSLKSLSLDGFSPTTQKKLKLSGGKLEEIKLSGFTGLKEIEIELPRLEKFVLRCDLSLPAAQIKKCKIKSSAANCQWEVEFWMSFNSGGGGRSWFVEFKRFIAINPNFQTVKVSFQPLSKMVEVRVPNLDCEGCASKLRKTLFKLKVRGYSLEEKKILKAIKRAGKSAEPWPFPGYAHFSSFYKYPTYIVNHYYDPYKNVAGGGSNNSVHSFFQTPAVYSVAVASDEAVASIFSDDNPHACSIM